MLQKRHIEFLLWVLFLSSLGWGLFSQLTLRQTKDAYLSDAAKKFERYLNQESRAFENWLLEFKKEGINPSSFIAQQDFIANHPIGGYWLVFKNDKAVYWSSNRISPSEIRAFEAKEGLIELSNGVFHAQKVSFGDTLTGIYLILIKDRFSFENQFLNNKFAISFDGIDEIRMRDAKRSAQKVRAPSGITLFTITLHANRSSLLLSSHEHDSGLAFLMAILFAVMLFFMKIEEEQVHKRPFRTFLELVTSLIVIRVLLFVYHDKIGLQSVELFDPTLFASHWLLPSLGDLLLHLSVILLAIIYLFRFRVIYDKVFVDLLPTLRSLPIQFVLILLTVLFFLVSLLVSRDLVFSSEIPIGLDQLFDFNAYTYLTLGLYVLFIWINVASFYFLSKYVLWQMTPFRLLMNYTAAFCLIYFMFSFTGEIVWLRSYYIQWLVLGLLLYFFRTRWVQRFRLFNVLLVLWSLFIGYQVSEALFRRQTEQARFLARKIFAPEDRVAVYALLDLIPRLQTDELLKRYADRSYELDDNFRNRLVYKYLQGYLDRYTLSELKIITGGEEISGPQLQDMSLQLELNKLQLIKQYRQNARLGYSLRIPFITSYERVDTLSIRLLQKSLASESPFPALLLEGDGGNQAPPLGTRSFAYYDNNLLVQQGGKFPYALIDDKWRNFEGEFNLHQEAGHWHFIYRPDSLNVIVVSFVGGGFFAFFSVSAALFLLSIVVVFLLSRLFKVLTNPATSLRLSYRNRIEISLLGSVVVIMIVVGYITITYTVLRNRNVKIEFIANRMQDIASSVENSLEDGFRANRLSDYQRLGLNQLASSYGADFSLFNLSGQLVYSSQEKLYEKKLVSELMEPAAFQALSRERKTVHIQDERIGDFKFVSAYLPLRNSKNEVVALFNMPSFSTEQELRNDLNAYLGNLISLYILILLTAGSLTLWLAERITSPLRLLTQVIQRTKVGEQTRMPDWKREDEIGIMIRSYNQMLQQLDDNARLLARSERESAWREMARQIAHEIRNPLTPMKLKLQRLRRDWTENRERFDTNYVKESGLVLEQIDILAAVASEFSSFAQVTVGEKKPFDLLENLEQVVGLYSSQARVVLENKCDDKTYPVYGDAQQVQRVFQNLVKNGIQAVPEDRAAEITIRLSKDKGNFVVDVLDNGNGILLEDRQKIFQPNFTTKSSGMGLGLAIVRKIIEQNDAEIGFETVIGKGTRFFVRFRIYQPEE